MELLKKCSFSEVFDKENLAPAPDSLNSARQPVKKMGHFRIIYDYGTTWSSQYIPCRNELKTHELVEESMSCLKKLEERFSSLEELREFCEQGHAEKVGEQEYNCYIEGRYGNYWLRFNTWKHDYNIYCHVFTK